ncbi:ABC transporter substrate-binding protein [Pseudorhizobium pelagicum]|uniref:Phosphate ABC transporter substrate-binding protein n=1 Tax=Pseudorhizobium pelagicum TaxID=1509405 RepID=A0A922P4H4_9HYPH|nr:ABC transporter substrate-binding protein [Pseudorhizobium pelagicum]KEQ03710.1 phosphate ABC transporter substrate-binding protein [Pseudorhizobium pelagicum]KEQ08235.1 phosphate ABC transporter substrate-binding protein [Pseudorhizobium pelagicum]
MTETQTPIHTLLAEYGVTRALRNGEVNSTLLRLNYADYDPSNLGFKAFVSEAAFQAGELAIVTFLMAKARGAPLVLMPAPISGRFQHHCIAYNAENRHLSPKDLEGKRVGVRAYTQTTGVWVRGILQNEYGVDLDKITWVCFEDAHVENYAEPSNVTRGQKGQKLVDMLLDGSLDAAMLGSNMPDDPRLKTVIPDPNEAAKAWYDRTGVIPLNHVFVVREDLSRERPDLVRELYRMLKESKAKAGLKGLDTRPYGVEANRKTLQTIIRYSRQQGLINRLLEVDELFDDVTRALE